MNFEDLNEQLDNLAEECMKSELWKAYTDLIEKTANKQLKSDDLAQIIGILIGQYLKHESEIAELKTQVKKLPEKATTTIIF